MASKIIATLLIIVALIGLLLIPASVIMFYAGLFNLSQGVSVMLTGMIFMGVSIVALDSI